MTSRQQQAAELPPDEPDVIQSLVQRAETMATGGLADVELPDGPKSGQTVKTTLFPITMDGQRLPVRLQPPRLGAHSAELLEGLGYAAEEIDKLRGQGAVA